HLPWARSHSSTWAFSALACRATCWASFGSFQKSGAPIFSSSAAASARFLSTSKIVPHFGDAAAQLLEALAHFADVNGRHRVSSSKTRLKLACQTALQPRVRSIDGSGHPAAMPSRAAARAPGSHALGVDGPWPRHPAALTGPAAAVLVLLAAAARTRGVAAPLLGSPALLHTGTGPPALPSACTSCRCRTATAPCGPPSGHPGAAAPAARAARLPAARRRPPPGRRRRNRWPGTAGPRRPRGRAALRPAPAPGTAL